jgi:membrane dipeptidase
VKEYSTRTVDLVRRSTVIDMLGLLTLDYRKPCAWETDPRRFQYADFLRLKDSGITVFHPPVGYNTGDIYTESLRDITGWNAFISEWRWTSRIVVTARPSTRSKPLPSPSW